MIRTALALPTYRGLQTETRNSIARLGQVAAQHSRQGISDVALARNVVLTAVLDDYAARGGFDVVLFVDDDMQFDASAACHLVQRARETGRATSAVYLTADSYVTACTWPETMPAKPGPKGEPTYLVGMGLCAIPIALLVDIAVERPRVRVQDGLTIVPFCASGPDFALGHWVSEDHMLSRALGGVLLEPVAAGHLKTIPLWPDDETIARITSGRELPKRPDVIPMRDRPVMVGTRSPVEAAE